jgi:hypothetical protein
MKITHNNHPKQTAERYKEKLLNLTRKFHSFAFGFDSIN